MDCKGEIMITANHCNVQACFDTGTFQYFSVTAPLKKHQYQNSIQDEYNLSYEDFTALEILIAGVVDKYLKEKEK
jgi:hypothetical protein